MHWCCQFFCKFIEDIISEFPQQELQSVEEELMIKDLKLLWRTEKTRLLLKKYYEEK